MAMQAANLALISLKLHQRVLFLQGPVGPAFAKMADWLQAQGKQVHKVCFNPGDAWDWRGAVGAQMHHFKADLEQWQPYLEQLLSCNSITALVLFGQGRRYHQQAMQVASKLGVQVHVMEEGYFRPGYVTFELGGVNGYSSTTPIAGGNSIDLSNHPWSPLPEVSALHFAKMAWHATLYYLVMWWQSRQYPAYQHHRPTSPWRYTGLWLRSWWRKGLRSNADHRLVQQLINKRVPYFFVPLQCPEDSQIDLHSRYTTIEQFLLEVLESFARHAPVTAHLLFKQHPMSRGETLYGSFIRHIAQQLGVQERVHFVTETHNPTVLDHCQGAVLINSTMGLQAMDHRKPVKALGEAFFNVCGLTDQQPLDTFWRQPQPPVIDIDAYLRAVKCLTQIPGSLYAMTNEPWQALDLYR